jgi:hypothetical protein
MWLLIGTVSGQKTEQSGSKIDYLASKCYSVDKSTDILLLKSIEQDSPNSRVYYVLALCKNGDAIRQRYVKNWAIQSATRRKLTGKQIEEIKQMLASPDSQFQTTSPRPTDKEKFTTFTFFNGIKYVQYNYSGDLPIKAQQVIDFVKAAIQKPQISISNQ